MFSCFDFVFVIVAGSVVAATAVASNGAVRKSWSALYEFRRSVGHTSRTYYTHVHICIHIELDSLVGFFALYYVRLIISFLEIHISVCSWCFIIINIFSMKNVLVV